LLIIWLIELLRVIECLKETRQTERGRSQENSLNKKKIKQNQEKMIQIIQQSEFQSKLSSTIRSEKGKRIFFLFSGISLKVNIGS
jgi:hypothetical protein